MSEIRGNREKLAYEKPDLRSYSSAELLASIGPARAIYGAGTEDVVSWVPGPHGYHHGHCHHQRH